MSPEPQLSGDPEALYMATPWPAARALAEALPPGPLLELCCGAGGTTVALARNHRLVAVDRDPARLAACRANLAAQGLAGRAALVACDLTRPALIPAMAFSACVLDPDWSPADRPTRDWAASLAHMEPPADLLLEMALCFSPRAVLRLPPGLKDLPAGHCQMVSRAGRVRFVYLYVGPWPQPPPDLDLDKEIGSGP